MRTPSPESAEEPKPYQPENDTSSSDAEDDQSPLTLSASRQMSRDLDEADREDSAGSTVQSASKKALSAVLSLLRPAWLLDHLDWPSFKVASRTWIHIWVSGLFVCVPALSTWTGSACYLAMILATVDPAGGQSVLLGALNSVLLLWVATIAFTAQVIANAINWQLRGRISLQDVYREVFGSGECPIGDAQCFQSVLLDGRYVTTRTTVVTSFTIFLTLLVTLWISNRQKLQTHMRMPLILCIIFCTIALLNTNHLPIFSPWTAGKVYFLPTFVGVAMRVVLSLVYFPTSSSANVTTNVWRLHAKIAKTSMDLHAKVRKTPLSDPKFPEVAESFGTQYNPSPMFWMMLAPDLPIMPCELLYARLDSEDIQEFIVALRRLASCQSSFTFLFNEFLDLRNTILEGQQGVQRRNTGASVATATGSQHPLQKFAGRRATFGEKAQRRRHGHWLKDQLRQEYLETGNFEAAFQKHMKDARVKFNSLDELQTVFDAVLEHHAPLIDAANAAALVASQWIDDANKFRLTALLWLPYRKKRVQKQREFAAKLDEALTLLDDEYRRVRGNCDWMFTSGALGADFTDAQVTYAVAQDVFCEYLSEQLMRIVRRLCRWCVFVNYTRPHATLVLPFQKPSLTKRERVIAHFRAQDKSGGLEELSPPENPKSFRPVQSAQKRNPNSSPPRNWFHIVGTHVSHLQKGLLSDEAIYCYKKASVALIPSILYFDRDYLRWAYMNRVLWVSIMAAMVCSPRAGDGMFALVVRAIMTLFGCVFGLVCWYISAGSGRGNPYGFAGCLAVAGGIIAYMRHYSTVGGIAARIVFCVTIVLVYAVSYVDENTASLTSLTSGWDVAWIRFVTVIVGLVLGFLVSVLPHAETTKKAVRIQMAGLLKSLAETQTEIVNFGLQRYDDDSVHQTYVKDLILEHLAIKMRGLSLLKLNMAMTRFEPPLTGSWPAGHYNLLMRLIGEMGYLQSSFYNVLNSIEDTSEILEVLGMMGMLDSDLLAGTFSLVYMCSNSLVTGAALPTITPGRLAPDHRLLLERHFEGIEGLAVFKDLARTRKGRSTLTAIRVAELYYKRLDATMAVVKRLVGEDFGFDSRMQELFNEHHLAS